MLRSPPTQTVWRAANASRHLHTRRVRNNYNIKEHWPLAGGHDDSTRDPPDSLIWGYFTLEPIHRALIVVFRVLRPARFVDVSIHRAHTTPPKGDDSGERVLREPTTGPRSRTVHETSVPSRPRRMSNWSDHHRHRAPSSDFVHPARLSHKLCLFVNCGRRAVGVRAAAGKPGDRRDRDRHGTAGLGEGAALR